MIEHQALLSAATGESMSLRRVSAAGHVDGMMLSMTVRQAYRNDTADTLETVYTFPMAWGAVLMGLAVEIAGRRLTGTVLGCAQAEARYEDAIASGDSPIMVQKSSDLLYTASLGNLKPGEEAVIEIRYAQLLRVEHGRVRLSVPTTIAPRYGDAARDAGIRAHEAVSASVAAAYPFDLSLRIAGPLAAGDIASPSHEIEVHRDASVTVVRLSRIGWLDRDFVLTLDAAGTGTAHAVRAPDGSGCVVLASFCPVLDARPRASVDLKILVDCSGSMGGDSIAAARRALDRVLDELQPSDRFSFSRFGTRVVHAFQGLCAAEPESLSMARAAVAQTDADLGGTNLRAALESTFALGGEAADVLLITDGEVWAIEQVVEAARASGHRVFAVGVGSAPAESLQRRLAEETGGACELVAPNEEIVAAIVRMFARMRVARAEAVSVSWGAEPVWTTAVPAAIFDGDTVHLFAGFDDPLVAVAPQLSFTLGQGDDAVSYTASAVVASAADRHGGPEPASPSEENESPSTTLPRLAAWTRIADRVRGDEGRGVEASWAADMAIRYRLVTAETNLFLVHERVGADKAGDLPTLQQAPQMLAAGWGGTGMIMRSVRGNGGAADTQDVFASYSRSAPGEALRRFLSPRRRLAFGRSDRSPTGDAPISRSVSAAPGPGSDATEGSAGTVRLTPRRLLGFVRTRLNGADDFDGIVQSLDRHATSPLFDEALRALAALGLSRRDAWLLVIVWLASRIGDPSVQGAAADQVIEAMLAGMPARDRDEGLKAAAGVFGTAKLNA